MASQIKKIMKRRQLLRSWPLASGPLLGGNASGQVAEVAGRHGQETFEYKEGNEGQYIVESIWKKWIPDSFSGIKIYKFFVRDNLLLKASFIFLKYDTGEVILLTFRQLLNVRMYKKCSTIIDSFPIADWLIKDCEAIIAAVDGNIHIKNKYNSGIGRYTYNIEVISLQGNFFMEFNRDAANLPQVVAKLGSEIFAFALKI